jgi:hypothetical protein
VAAGVERAYYPSAHKGSGAPVPVDVPVGHMQVVRAAYRKAGVASKWGGRAGRLGKDAIDVVGGKPRARDGSGRKRKREWEKAWFGNEAKKAAITAAVLGYATGMKRSPKFRAANISAAKAVRGKVNSYVPDFFPDTQIKPKGFDTPGSRLIELATKKEKQERRSEVAAGLKGAAGGGAVGAVLGAEAVAHGKTVRKHGERLHKAAVRDVSDSLERVGAGWKKSKKPSKPFGKGRFGRAERLARAKHESAATIRRTLKKGAVKGGLIGAGVLGGLSYAAQRSKRKKRFETAGSRMLVELDAAAAEKGWDIRDPRGKSARVFAPGSRKRKRREKKWHEEVGNERKLRTAATVAALVGGGALGVAIGRKLPRRTKLPKGAGGAVVPFKKKA